MIDFIKYVFASAIGFVLVFVLLFFFGFILVVATSGDPEPIVRDNSVLYVKVSGAVPERMAQDPLQEILGTGSRAAPSLENFEQNLQKAAVDSRIKGVLMEIDFVSTPWPILQQMRRAMQNFREESGKFLYATTNDIGFNEQGYYLATAADSIYSQPASLMQMTGFAVSQVFLEGALDKIGVEATVVRRGKYKSAGDGFQRQDYSEADEEQLRAIYDDIVEEFESAVAERSGMSRAELTEMLNQPPRLDIGYYAERGLLDGIMYMEELKAKIKDEIGLNDGLDLRMLANGSYAQVSASSAGLETPPGESVAVIYASGAIMPKMDDGGLPFGQDDTINIQNMRESIDQAANDPSVKAIVLRINSPGGAASTSDAIWNMLRKASEQKPVITSMAGVAASGGYYIGMGGDEIVAERTTITGSIGVIGIQFNAQELLEEKMGMQYEEIKFHNNANWLNPAKPLSPVQRQAFEQFIDITYQDFLERVAQSRNMSVDEVHEVAQGRVWSGADAMEVGLVDAVGGLDDAISLAAERAGIENYSIRRLPRPKTFIEQLATAGQVQAARIFGPGINVPHQRELQMVHYLLTEQKRPQAWAVMPHLLELK